MSYYTKPRPGTVGDNLHSGTSSLLDQLMNLRNPNAPRSVFEASPAQMEVLNEQKAVAADADARAEKEWRAKRMAQQDANIRRANGLPPLPVESTAQVPPESVMSVAPAPEELMSSAQNFTPATATSAKDESGPVNMPVRDLGIVPVPPLAAGSAESGKKSSTLRSQASKGAPVEAAVAAAPTEQAAAAPAKDAIAEMLSGKLTAAEGDRDSAKARALAAKEMNDGEKIFTALMAVLPGLVGAIGGGAIAGGAGAAAGAAGGLNGGAGAIGAMMGEKEQLRQEALGQEAAAQQRMDQVGNQQLGHAEKLQGQEFQVGERKANEQFTVAGREDEQQFRGDQERKKMAHDQSLLMQKFRHEWRMAQEQNAVDFAKSMRPGAMQKLEEGDKSFYVNTHSAVRDIEELKKVVGKTGNIELALIGDPKARAILQGRAYDLAIAYAKIVDPGTAAREGEVEAAKKNGFPMGLLEGNATSAAALDNMMQMIREKGSARMDLGLPVPASLGLSAPQAQFQINASDHEAVRWARNEGARENPAKAAAILQAHGL